MILEKSQCFTHGQSTNENNCHSKEEVQNILLQTMKDQGINATEVGITDDGTLDVEKIPPLKLHSVMLRMEEQGLNIKYTKKTLIEIS